MFWLPDEGIAPAKVRVRQSGAEERLFYLRTITMPDQN
jgi:hypothetical protein